jgi:hypothetical protein
MRKSTSKGFPPCNTMEMELEASLIKDDGYSKEVFKHCSIQGQMGVKVLKTSAWCSKIEVKREEEEGRKGSNLKVGIEVCLLV